jgi:hypothetical protein
MAVGNKCSQLDSLIENAWLARHSDSTPQFMGSFLGRHKRETGFPSGKGCVRTGPEGRVRVPTAAADTTGAAESDSSAAFERFGL